MAENVIRELLQGDDFLICGHIEIEQETYFNGDVCVELTRDGQVYLNDKEVIDGKDSSR